MVSFSCKSLTEDESYSGFKNKMDIIFCRNVLMYFSAEWVNKISKNLFDSLKDDGWFIVSSSELSSYVFPQYTAVNFPGAVLYSKTKIGHAHKLAEYVPVEEKFQPIVTSPIQPVSPSIVLHSFLDHRGLAEGGSDGESPSLPLSPSPILPFSPSLCNHQTPSRGELYSQKSSLSAC